MLPAAFCVANRGLSVTVHSSTGFRQDPKGRQQRHSIPLPPSQPLANVTIQYGLMIKILDMFFDCKYDRWLQTIHYQAISKILDTKSLIS